MVSRQWTSVHTFIYINIPYTPTIMRCHSWPPTSFNDHPMMSSMRSARPPQPQRKVFPPSFSHGNTAACFPSLLIVILEGMVVAWYLRCKWAKTAVNTFLSLPDWWMLSMEVMWVLPGISLSCFTKHTGTMEHDKHQTEFTSQSRVSVGKKNLLNTAHVWLGRWQSHNAAILASSRNQLV